MINTDKKNILCLGHAVLDQIYSVSTLPVAGKNFATAFMEAGGGPAATASVTISRLGHAATLWTRLGDDGAGDRIQAELEFYGVNMGGLPRVSGAVSAQAALAVDARGERMIINYLDPKLPRNTPDWLPVSQVKDFDCVLVDTRWKGGAVDVLKEAARHGIPSVADADLTPDAEALREIPPLAEHAIFSEGGLKIYSGEDSPEAGLRVAAAGITGTPYVTLGGEGCMWWNRQSASVEFFRAFKVPVKDTTGAGDVFHGAFAIALVEGKAGREAVGFASAAAALKCTGMGGRAAIPDREALKAFLRAYAG